MDHALGVHDLQRGEDLVRHLVQQVLGQDAQLVDRLAQRLALHQLHRHEVVRRAVDLLAADLVGGHDVLVADADTQLRLALEALEDPLVGDQFRVEDLDGDHGAGLAGGAGRDGAGLVDRSPPALADEAADLVGAERLSGQGRLGHPVFL